MKGFVGVNLNSRVLATSVPYCDAGSLGLMFLLMRALCLFFDAVDFFTDFLISSLYVFVSRTG